MRLSLLNNLQLKKAALVGVLCLDVVLMQPQAHALEEDVIRPYVNVSYTYDDNIRRFNNKARAQLLTGSSNLSDTVLTTGVGIILDKQISQQRIFVDFNINKSKYDRNSALDNNAKEMTGRWDWKVGRRWDGKFELYHKEAMVPFTDFFTNDPRALSLNTRTSDRRLIEARWMMHPRWRLRGAVVNYEIEYSADIQKAANLEENSQELSLDYLSPSKSIVGILYRQVKGNKPEQIFLGALISNDYAQNEWKLNIDWAITGKTKVQFLGGVVDRQHEQLSSRDFRGVNLRGNFSWVPTGKTDLRWMVWRENNAQSFVTTSYTLNQGSSVTASWIATEKVMLQGSLRYEKRDFEGDAIFGQLRSDKDKSAMVSLIYKPISSFRFNASFIHSSRDSSSDVFGFKSNSVSLSGQYEF
ncbi:XrtB/PEP-CTERM-associated polysaccharide biosynthesis outer membrane protein EpsL [Methylobacillus sp. Pita1]|uniref:XrtB/PEP-CTERM-associated polysaccharide biosynthesis outer membrane protein EpsL n=1 Tax=Methylobacillus sp. Pita1 TaxID=3382642 RepID=UPI0038B6A5E4